MFASGNERRSSCAIASLRRCADSAQTLGMGLLAPEPASTRSRTAPEQRGRLMVSSATLRSRSANLALTLAGLFAVATLGACVDPPKRQGGGPADAGKAKADAAKGPKREATIPAEGWNDDIAWRGLDEGLREAKQSGMPVMMV